MTDYKIKSQLVQKFPKGNRFHEDATNSGFALVVLFFVGIFWGLIILAVIRHFDNPRPPLGTGQECVECHGRLQAYTKYLGNNKVAAEVVMQPRANSTMAHVARIESRRPVSQRLSDRELLLAELVRP